MKIVRAYSAFNLIPRLYRAERDDAPFRMIIAFGFWAILLGGRHD